VPPIKLCKKKTPRHKFANTPIIVYLKKENLIYFQSINNPNKYHSTWNKDKWKYFKLTTKKRMYRRKSTEKIGFLWKFIFRMFELNKKIFGYFYTYFWIVIISWIIVIESVKNIDNRFLKGVVFSFTPIKNQLVDAIFSEIIEWCNQEGYKLSWKIPQQIYFENFHQYPHTRKFWILESTECCALQIKYSRKRIYW
jgi:hypothetical protein